MSLPPASFEPATDDELTGLALAADPDVELGDDAVCLWDLRQPEAAELLPTWYMPAPGGRSRLLAGGSRKVAFVIIAALLAINACGLCVTYGRVALG